MLDKKFSLRWKSYQNKICNGFSYLQQMQEFVDVTIAANGTLVKAHQSILALASPYIKEMLKSVPCQHPVIFLGPISERILSYILEYIYTGEVEVPSSLLSSFIEGAKMLHIVGAEHFTQPSSKHIQSTVNPTVVNEQVESLGLNNVATNIRIGPDKKHEVEPVTNISTQMPQNFQNSFINSLNVKQDEPVSNGPRNLVANIILDNTNVMQMQPLMMNNQEVTTDKVDIEMQNEVLNSNIENRSTNELAACITIQPLLHYYGPSTTDLRNLEPNVVVHTNETNVNQGYDNEMAYEYTEAKDSVGEANAKSSSGTNVDLNSESGYICVDSSTNNNNASSPNTIEVIEVANSDNPKEKIDLIPTTPLYTTSNRGSLQLILNRFVYCLHHTSYGGRKRRWRCMNYRKLQCKAFVDTDNEVVVSRKHSHIHGFHDAKILKLGKRKQLFTSIQQAHEKIRSSGKE